MTPQELVAAALEARHACLRPLQPLSGRRSPACR